MGSATGVQQLEAMGFTEQVAKYALSKTSGNIERAIDWLFSAEGSKFVDNPVVPSEGDHRPPDSSVDAALRSSAAQVVAPNYGSGVRNITGFSMHDGATVSHNEVVDITDEKSAEDKEMEAAIALSLGREGAPPPPSYGPSNRVEDGSTAMVPHTGNEAEPISVDADNDADLDRAIQDSLMTASFHSMSAMPTEAPANSERQPETPIVFRAPDAGSTYAAHLLQALYAVPHFRNVIRLLPLPQGGDAGIRALQQLVVEADASSMAYHDVGAATTAIRQGKEPYQLPPADPSRLMWEDITVGLQTSTTGTHEERFETASSSDIPFSVAQRLRNPLRLIQTTVASTLDAQTTSTPTWVNVSRDYETDTTISAALAKIMWIDGQGMDSIVDLGDILVFLVTGSIRVPWQMEEVIYMDRFMRENAARSAQLRAEQSLALGNARRLKDKLQTLTVHKDQRILDSLQRAIKHLDESPDADDVVQNETTREMKIQLQSILNNLQTKVSELQAELEAEEKKAAGGLFETDDPAYLKHGYRLHAALWHDGFPSGLNHLYAYVRSDDGAWWKIADHEATKTDFATIAADRVGLYTDGGPYLLVYARDGDAPPTPIMTPQPEPVEVIEEPLAVPKTEDIEMVDGEQADVVEKELLNSEVAGTVSNVDVASKVEEMTQEIEQGIA